MEQPEQVMNFLTVLGAPLSKIEARMGCGSLLSEPNSNQCLETTVYRRLGLGESQLQRLRAVVPAHSTEDHL